ncbi:MAG: hypothetical protein ACFBZ8_09455 [Opitutales bacterium]
MSFAAQLREALAAQDADLSGLSAAADARLEALADWCALYRSELQKVPEIWLWLEDTEVRDQTLRFSALRQIWERRFAPTGSTSGEPKALTACLRRFRRQLSLRIAYRELGGLAQLDESLHDLTRLAEFTITLCFELAWQVNEPRLGTPWDDEADAPARACVLGLGKLGGEELNFCSDVDLIFFFEGEGHCRKSSGRAGPHNSEFFGRLFQDVSRYLTERGPEGILYNLDLRLRPEGDSGPLVRSFTGLANYYWANGQTWERLALMKARPVAGDRSLGLELLEEINPFRYPRSPPPHLLPEVMGVKLRTEKEVVGAGDLERDIKNGPGGIREIEFMLQARQMIEGGRSPFLQTGSTRESLGQLERYGFLDSAEAGFLREAYSFLRRVENRLQMRREARTHQLPETGSPERARLAQTLGFDAPADFEERLESVRKQVRARYEAFFGTDDREAELQDWTVFLSGHAPDTAIEARLSEWFPGEQDCAERLQTFAVGTSKGPLTRESVQLFLDTTRHFEGIFPQLAEPLTALDRVGGFAGSYGARKQFYKACNANPGFFQALCLLFDRSGFIHRLLAQHPGIMEELLHEAPRRDKSLDELLEEIGHLPQDAPDFPRLLWQYVKAEQVRLAMGELLFERSIPEITADLSDLAEATVRTVLRRVDPEGELALVALGKFGGREVSFGSDLDMMILGPVRTEGNLAKKATAFIKEMQFSQPLGRIFEVDLRLRPHGKDGPLVTTLPAFEYYHTTAGAGQSWERTALTRARFAGGNEQLAAAFVEMRNALIFEKPLSAEAVAHLRSMRERIVREKGQVDPPERAYKAGAGGLVSIEFMVQLLQRRHGAAFEQLRQSNTRENLRFLGKQGLLPENTAEALVAAYDQLRRVELYLRRDAWNGVSEISTNARIQQKLARWLGYERFETLAKALRQAMADVQAAEARVYAALPRGDND